MIVDNTRIGLIRAMAAHPRERQRRALTAAGATRIVEIGKHGISRDDILEKYKRPDDVLLIEALALLAEPRGKGTVSPMIDLVDALDDALDRGWTIIETCSGRSTANKAERRAMKRDALDALRRGARALPSQIAAANGAHAKRGRRPTAFSDLDIERARAVWRNTLEFPTYAAAGAALPEGFSVARAYDMWGGRLRKTK